MTLRLTLFAAAIAACLPAPAPAVDTCTRQCAVTCFYTRCPLAAGEDPGTIIDPQPANEDPATGRVAVFETWSAHRVLVDGRPVCWVASEPFATSPLFEDRKLTAVVTVPEGELLVHAEDDGFKGYFEGSIIYANDPAYRVRFRDSDGWLLDERNRVKIFLLLADRQFLRFDLQGDGFTFTGIGFFEAFTHAVYACVRQ